MVVARRPDNVGQLGGIPVIAGIQLFLAPLGAGGEAHHAGGQFEQFAVHTQPHVEHGVAGGLVTLVGHHVVQPFLAGHLGAVEVGGHAAGGARIGIGADRVARGVHGHVAGQQPLVATHHVGGGDVVTHRAPAQEALPVDPVGQTAGQVGAEADGIAAVDLARHRQVRVVPVHRQLGQALGQHVLAQRLRQERIIQPRDATRMGNAGFRIAAPPVGRPHIVTVARPLRVAAHVAGGVAEAGVPDQVRIDLEFQVGVGRSLLRLVAQQHVVIDAERGIGATILGAGVVVGDGAVAVARDVGHLAVDQLVPVAILRIGAARRHASVHAPGGVVRTVELAKVDDDVVGDAVVGTGVLRVHLVHLPVGEAVQQRDVISEHVVCADHQVRAVIKKIEAGGDRSLGLARIALFRHAGADRRRRAVHALLHDDVDRAGHRIGAVDRRGAAGHRLDAVDQRRGNGVQVNGRGARAARYPAQPVHQHQRAVGAHAAQVDVGHALVVLLAHRVHLAQAGTDGGIEHQRVIDGEAAGVLDLVKVDHRDRHHRFQLRPRDARTGYHHTVQLGGGGGAARIAVRGAIRRLVQGFALLCPSWHCRAKRDRDRHSHPAATDTGGTAHEPTPTAWGSREGSAKKVNIPLQPDCSGAVRERGHAGQVP